MKIPGVTLSNTEQAVLNVIADGLPHRPEAFNHLFDSMTLRSNIKVHVSNIRVKIRPKGYDVVNVSNGKWSRYQLVRLLHKDVYNKINSRDKNEE